MMLKKRLTLSLLGLVLMISSYGQNEKFKALFIYNFTNYIEWPSVGSTFLISVLGDSPIIAELENISKIKKIGSATIEVRKVSSCAEAGQSQILFIPSSKRKAATEAALALEGKSVLIITDSNSNVYGINFIETGQKQAFQVSKNAIESHKLKINSALLSLGIPVN